MHANYGLGIGDLYYAARLRARIRSVLSDGTRLGVLAGVTMGATAVALEYAGRGRDIGYEFTLLPLVAIVVLGASCVPFSIFARTRRAATTTLVACVVTTPLLLAALPLVSFASNSALARLADRSAPLVAALHAYERVHREPVPNLRALVPTFLATVPTTGVPDAPNYTYSLSNSAGRRPWRLGVDLGGFFDFDDFEYVPAQEPVPLGSRGDARFGDWLLNDRD